MKTLITGVVSLLLIFGGFFVLSAQTTDDYVLTHKVVNIIDGDTIKVNLEGGIKTVRLIGIDTPETKDPRKPVQCFGKEATTYLDTLLADREVVLVADESQGDADHYGRLLRFLFVGETNINLELVKQGYAFEYTFRTPYKYQKEFKQAQENARKENRGLWSAC